MRVFSAGLDSETNTFTNLPTTWKSFERGGIWRGDAGSGHCWMSPVPLTWQTLAFQYNLEYVEGTYAAAKPAGPVLRPVYESLRDEILHQMTVRGPFDIVLLHLHGAMVAEGYDDCEGDILSRARALLPPTAVIGVVLDPHCHLTDAMVENADVLIACKYYPHDDYAERAAEVFTLCLRTARKEVKPVPGVFDCKMIGVFPTTQEPMAGVVRDLIAAERAPGILSASFIHGFAAGDTADTGSKMIVYAQGDRQRAIDCARRLGRSVYDLRGGLVLRYPSVDEALDRALEGDGLTVLADTADNPGGGAAGDNVLVLEALLRRRVKDAALAAIWDPQVAELCAECGTGARLELRLGGKTNTSSGMPADVSAVVRAVNPQHYQTSLGDTRQDMGLCVWLEVYGIDVVVSTVRSQVFAPDIFTGIGIDLSLKRLVVVKSMHHFYSRFAPLARQVIHMTSPGASSLDFANIPYRKRALDYFPRIGDPLMNASGPGML